ncbi:MAG: diphthine-ammonia ligase [Candidatus Woesearchaeota archaeon]|jgi:diphthine-ammonia ligase
MCGIIGTFNNEKAVLTIQEGLGKLSHRGKDGFGVATASTCMVGEEVPLLMSHDTAAVGHCLHSIVSHVKQPLHQVGTFVANCEIYNWKELAKKHNLDVTNDAQLLFELLESCDDFTQIPKLLEDINGVYAFAYWKENKVILCRDILGEKPLFYEQKDTSFSFASEKKVLSKHAQELNPRHMIIYSIDSNIITDIQRPFFELTEETKESPEVIAQKVEQLFKKAVQIRVTDKKIGILFSGGIDSTILAYQLKLLGVDFTCYTAAIDEPGMKEAEDLVWAKRVSKELDFKLEIVTITAKEAEILLAEVIPIIESSNVVKVGVALPFYAAAKKAKEDGIKVMYSGLGSEEIFAGYQRHEQSQNINQECVSGLRKLYERDLYRDDCITMSQQIEIRLPFLDLELVKYALTIPDTLKISDTQKKIIIRTVAENLGIPEPIAQRPKKAAQYGSKSDRIIQKLAKQHGHGLKSQYLHSFFPAQNQKLAILLSGGKDSLYAMQTMQKQNYPIECAITIESTNEHSYMFHTPAINMTSLQTQSLGIPHIIQKTSGEKEAELVDLQKAIKQAKETYGIDGIITGALYSVYQRERVEKIAEELGLLVFSPLWHIDQEKELRAIIDAGYTVILTRVAADGLDQSFLNKPLTHSDVDTFVKLHKKNGFHIAGEGGEFESLVLNGPGFSKKIIIETADVVDEQDNSYKLRIDQAHLLD